MLIAWFQRLRFWIDVWQYDFRGDAGIVETYISYLRKKIDSLRTSFDSHGPRVGYRLRMPAKK
jgi:two-component system OmpR family response regulator